MHLHAYAHQPQPCGWPTTLSSHFILRHFTSLYVILHHSTSLYITLRHSTSLHVTLRHLTSSYHSTSLSVTLRHSTSLYVTVRHCTSLYVTLRHFTSFYVTLRHFTSLYFTLRHFRSALPSPHFLQRKQTNQKSLTSSQVYTYTLQTCMLLPSFLYTSAQIQKTHSTRAASIFSSHT